MQEGIIRRFKDLTSRPTSWPEKHRQLVPHPNSDVVPSLTKEEFDKLYESIRSHGQTTPILAKGKYIIDGVNRFVVCAQCGIPLRVELYGGTDEEAAALVFVQALHRRHLSVSQLAALSVLYAKSLELSGNGKLSESIAETAGVSARTIDHAKVVINSDDPELKEAVIAGRMKVSRAASMVKKARASNPKTKKGKAPKSKLFNGVKAIYGEASPEFTERIIITFSSVPAQQWVNSLLDACRSIPTAVFGTRAIAALLVPEEGK